MIAQCREGRQGPDQGGAVDYSFSYDEQRIFLTVTQAGYWSMETFERYKQDYLAWHSQIRSRHRHYRVFAECSDYPVQSIEVGEAFHALFQKLMDENRGHVAIMVGSSLNKLQAQRVLPQPNVKVFIDSEAAMTWLFEPGSLPAT